MKAYPIKVRGKYGLIDRQGNVVIDPIKYDMIGSAVNGRALAFQSGDWFLIDGARVTGMPPEATYMFNSYGESVFLAEDEDYLGGYIDSAGRWSIERRFREARSFHFGMAVVKDGNDTKFKVIDTKGGDVFAAEWDGISDFSESGAAARKGDKRFLLKHSGESFEMDGAEDMHAPSEGVVACSMRGAGRKSWKFFDVESRSLLFEEGFASVHRFASGLCGVRSGKEYQFVNMKGARINDFVYKDTGVFHQGVCPARALDRPGKWGAVNMAGEWVIEPKYDGCEHMPIDARGNSELSGELIFVWKGNYVMDTCSFGYHDYSGNLIWPLQK